MLWKERRDTIRDFWATVAAGLKARMGIRLGAFVSCYFVAYAPSVSLKLVALFFATSFGCLMFLRDYGAFTKPLQTWWKLRGRVSWEAPPSFLTDLATKMHVKLNKKHPFGVTDAQIGAAASMFSSQVIVSREVLALSEVERNAVVAHELAHLRPSQLMKLLLLSYVVMLGASAMGNVHPIIVTIGGTALFLILRTFVSWGLEYDADRVGSGYSSGEALASALRHLVKPEEYDEPSDTHPSVNSRIARLLTPKEPLWIRLCLSLMGIFTTKSFRDEFLYSYIQDLKDHCQRAPKFLRPIVIAVELLGAILIWGRHRIWRNR